MKPTNPDEKEETKMPPTKQPTPTPWHLNSQINGQLYIEHAKGMICDMQYPSAVQMNEAEQARADAAFIVRAVNAHEELLAGCKAFIAYTRTIDPTVGLAQAREQSQDAIAKAEGFKTWGAYRSSNIEKGNAGEEQKKQDDKFLQRQQEAMDRTEGY